ncbi:MAG: hypothetical protein WBB94_04670 [Candidatus Saccharimonadaceae bacterium]
MDNQQITNTNIDVPIASTNIEPVVSTPIQLNVSGQVSQTQDKRFKVFLLVGLITGVIVPGIMLISYYIPLLRLFMVVTGSFFLFILGLVLSTAINKSILSRASVEQPLRILNIAGIAYIATIMSLMFAMQRIMIVIGSDFPRNNAYAIMMLVVAIILYGVYGLAYDISQHKAKKARYIVIAGVFIVTAISFSSIVTTVIKSTEKASYVNVSFDVYIPKESSEFMVGKITGFTNEKNTDSPQELSLFVRLRNHEYKTDTYNYQVDFSAGVLKFPGTLPTANCGESYGATTETLDEYTCELIKEVGDKKIYKKTRTRSNAKFIDEYYFMVTPSTHVYATPYGEDKKPSEAKAIRFFEDLRVASKDELESLIVKDWP